MQMACRVRQRSGARIRRNDPGRRHQTRARRKSGCLQDFKQDGALDAETGQPLPQGGVADIQNGAAGVH